MRHLSEEILARLVDEEPAPAQEEHLATCDRCSRILGELREQTEALGSLPALRPPAGDWEELEARLVRRGLVGSGSRSGSAIRRGSEAGAEGGSAAEVGSSVDSEAPGGARPEPAYGAQSADAGRSTLYSGSGWMQIAAALVLFLGGTAFGAWIGPGATTGSGVGEVVDAAPRLATGATAEETGSPTEAAGNPSTDATIPGASSVDEAALELRAAEDRYVDALVNYRQTVRSSRGAGSGSGEAENPAARVAALEALVAASQEAIRHAPADPFFNGVLASTMAERQAAIRQISASSDDSWF